jgi:hypothetical protein
MSCGNRPSMRGVGTYLDTCRSQSGEAFLATKALPAMTGRGERRTCQRHDHKRAVAIRLSGGAVVICRLVNVSLGGVLVSVGDEVGRFVVGQTVELYIGRQARDAIFRGVVIRIGNHVVGLSLEGQWAARFGLALARGLLSRRGRISAARLFIEGQ